jgi:signal transduction histidine kinase
MPREASNTQLTLALNTMLEREFVSPLTSIRSALEIMRDFADLSDEERSRFLNNALQDCTRLEQGVEQLASTVYVSVNREQSEQPQTAQKDCDSEYADRIQLIEELQVVEVDFSDFVFSSSKIVNAFYDSLDQLIESTGKRWYIIVNYQHCSIWPEAWVAFAHRGKKVNVSYSLGTVRYFNACEVDEGSSLLSDPDLLPSRDEALARIEQLRRTTPHK